MNLKKKYRKYKKKYRLTVNYAEYLHGKKNQTAFGHGFFHTEHTYNTATREPFIFLD